MDLYGDSPIRRSGSSTTSTAVPWQDAFWHDVSAEAFQSLSQPQKSELVSLRAETDPEIFAADLIQFAGRREREGRPDLALLLYQKLSDSPAIPDDSRKLALRRAEALQGQGTVGARAEVLLSRFFDEASNPAPIVAMGLAGSAFKLGRAFSLNFLRQAPLGMGIARAGANTFGLLTESATFTLSAKAVSESLGHRQDWSFPTLKQEWVAGTLLLGSLKVAGAAGHQAGRGFSQLANRAEDIALRKGLLLAAEVTQPLSLYSGILFSHHLETGLGLRPRQDGATSMIDGAATLLHLYVGGGLAQRLGAERLSRATTELEMRMGNRPKPSAFFPDFFSPVPALAMAGKIGERYVEPVLSQKNSPLQMAALAPETARSFGIEELYAVRDFVQTMPDSTNDALRYLFHHYSGMRETSAQHQFLLLLSRTSVGKESQVIEAALPTLCEAAKFSEAEGVASSYSHWLTKHVFERSLQRFDPAILDQLLRFLATGGKVTDFETQLASFYPEESLSKRPPPLPDFWRGREKLYGRIRNLELSDQSKRVLGRWAQALIFSPRTTFSESDFKLLGLIEYNLGLLRPAEAIDRAIKLAGDSPLSMARLSRLRLLLEGRSDRLTDFKLAELADPNATIFGSLHPWEASNSTAPSQSNAYLGAQAPLKLIAEMKARQTDLLDPANIESRKVHRYLVLEDLFPEGVRAEHFRPDVLAEAFRRLGDPQSLEIARAILRKDFNLEVLSNKAFQLRASEFSHVEVTASAFYYPPTKNGTKGLMLIRQPESTVYSKEASRTAYFEMMGNIAHEHYHHIDMDPRQMRTKDVHLYQEMSAHFSEFLWRASHGDTKNYEIWTRNTGLGPAMRFHDFFEQVYGHWWKQPFDLYQATLRAGRQGP